MSHLLLRYNTGQQKRYPVAYLVSLELFKPPVDYPPLLPFELLSYGLAAKEPRDFSEVVEFGLLGHGFQ